MGQMDRSGTEDLGLLARLEYGYVLSPVGVLSPVETSYGEFLTSSIFSSFSVVRDQRILLAVVTHDKNDSPSFGIRPLAKSSVLHWSARKLEAVSTLESRNIASLARASISCSLAGDCAKLNEAGC
jgi:hypothetical protein